MFAKRSFGKVTEELDRNFLNFLISIFIHLFDLQKCSGIVKKVTPESCYLKMTVVDPTLSNFLIREIIFFALNHCSGNSVHCCAYFYTRLLSQYEFSEMKI